MESMTVASFSVAETAPKERKVTTPKPSRRPSLIRGPCLRPAGFPSGPFRSLAACAHVDLGHAFGIAPEPHFVARQFRHTKTNQARASFCDKAFHRHRLEAGVPDAGSLVP